MLSLSRNKILNNNILKYSLRVGAIQSPLLFIAPLKLVTSTIRTFAKLKVSSSKYERKTPIEHILLRPGMYIGSTSLVELDTWVYDDSVTKRFMKQQVKISPALLKIFDEILVNAADNYSNDKRMNRIDISVNCDIDSSALNISIKNNGNNIPIEIHQKENIYIPELIFGHLLTGSNFDDNQERLTGGSHGYGAKLTNIYSKRFEIQTYDHNKKLLYTQEWSDNMSKASIPNISKCSLEESFTKFTFEPDLKKLGYNKITSGNINDILLMFQRRCLDIAAYVGPHVLVYYNDKVLPVSSFGSYVNIFSSDANMSTYQSSNKRWNISVSKSQTGTFECISFVNSVWTTKGGNHVNYITSQITKHISTVINAKKKTGYSLTKIKEKIMIVINCQIENPSFEGQTKDSLATSPENFGSTCVLPESYLNRIISESGIIEEILEDIDQLETKKLNSKLPEKSFLKKSVLLIPKLEDAHRAGGKSSAKCTLILTEGDSAKALAVAGLSVIGREYYGVLPLRGKLLNVRISSKAQLMKNEEILNLCKALGLKFNEKYDNKLNGLRYGKVMIMCDQDTDGSHIKGLIINLFHHLWPNLLSINGFLSQFITPIVKVKQKNNVLNDVNIKSFYSLQEYDLWRSSIISPSKSNTNNSQELNNYSIKYYKGLGTNTSKEGEEYFSNLSKHQKQFRIGNNIQTNDLIDMAFSKIRANDRKNWIEKTHSSNLTDLFINPTQKTVSYEEFMNKEFIQYSIADNIRSIPSVIDGLKPSQRKVLYACFKRDLKDEMKVVQIAGYIAEKTVYHHGEVSLHNTIINMAQNYTGSNNVPLLDGIGQFGTRNQGGKDFASPRYIFTKLSSIARLIFPALDDRILDYDEEDGLKVEPIYFIPIIPFILLNGSSGIGSGWSTDIPSYNIFDIINIIKEKIINNKYNKNQVSSTTKLVPFKFRNNSNVIATGITGRYISEGIINRINSKTLHITELPFDTWTDDYKSVLMDMISNNYIQSYTENHTNDSVHFVIIGTEVMIDELVNKGLIKSFKLSSIILETNMHAFDKSKNIKKYNTPFEMIDYYFPIRLHAYEKRKKYLLRNFEAEEMLSRKRSDFIEEILNGKIKLFNYELKNSNNNAIGRDELIEKLISRGFPTLNMPIQSITKEKSIKLQTIAKEAASQLEQLKSQSPHDMWLNDLENLIIKCNELYK
eukprot:gene4447-6290_t